MLYRETYMLSRARRSTFDGVLIDVVGSCVCDIAQGERDVSGEVTASEAFWV